MTQIRDSSIEELQKRTNTIKRHVLNMIYEAGSGHPGGSMSCAEILTTLYFHVIKHDPQNCVWNERDRFVLSKGHAAPALYAVLAECGYFPIEELKHLREFNSILQGHPEKRRLRGVEISTGSLGQGLSASVGMALAARLDHKDYRVYTLLGDGECQEGQIWEAAMSASHYKLDTLTAIIDRNGLQIDGPTEKVMSIEPISNKWNAFGWHVIQIDGHDFNQILDAFEEAKNTKGQPTAIIAHTFKGKGVSFMEWVCGFHGKAPNSDELEKALHELNDG